MKANKFVAFALLLLAVATSTAYAQSDRGTLTGTVTDPSGAVVANARVVATNAETGETREATTTDQGNYTIPELPAAPYRLTVELTGFKTATVEDIQVAVQSTRTADVQLEIGAAGESVTITAEQQTIQTETSVRQTNVTERQVRELPLQVGAEIAGRTPLAFIFLDSNVTGAGGSGGTDSSRFRISGGQALGTEILIDGASTRRTQNGTFFSEVAPSPNAFQEFTISTDTFSAEFGNSSGGIVNFTLRSGTNDFHGEAYDILRNEVLNANTFRNNAAGRDRNGDEILPRPRDNQNNFGFNVGGPIYLPRFGEGGPAFLSGKNRAFFFFNYEGYRFQQGENVLITVPTARMRTGDFSELLTDPYVRSFRDAGGTLVFPNGVQIYDPRQAPEVRAAIPGNRLDQYLGGARIDPAGLRALQFFPLPNRTGPNGSTVFQNYAASSTRPTDMNQYTTKLDFVASEKQRVTGSFSYRTNDRFASFNNRFPRFPLPFIAQDVWIQDFESIFVRLQHDYTITPTLLNHFNVGFTRYNVGNRNTTEGFDTSSLGIPRNATQNIAFPRLGFPGYGDPTTSTDPRAYQDIGSSFFSDRVRDNALQFSDFVTYVRGRQTMRFGGDIRTSQFNLFQRIDPGGSFNFRNDQTARNDDPNGGWPIASLITGATEFSFNFTNSIDPAFRQFSQSYFFQDDIKVTQRLTLNLGIRYDLPGLRTEARDRYRTFDPTAINPDARLGGRRGAIAGAGAQGGVEAEFDTLVRQDRSNIGPRVGFAYSLNDRTVLRGGGGIYYAPILYGFDGNNDLNTGLIGFNTGSGPRRPGGAGDRQSNFFLSSYPSIPAVDPGGQFVFSNGGFDVQFFDPDFRTGRTVQYTLELQRQLPSNFVAAVAYSGNKGTRLRSNFGRLNALPLNALRLGIGILDRPLPDLLADPNIGAIRAYAQSVGVQLPTSANAVFTGFDGTVAQALKPFPQYNRINNILESQGTSNYNALQLKLDRRFTRGIQFGASYTFSKLLTDAAEDLFGGSPLGGVLQNPFDRRSLRSISANNPTHVVVFNYLLELPFGKGRRFLDRGGIVDKLVGGFQINGIQRYESGLPLALFTPRGNRFLDIAGVGGNLRLNRTNQPLDPSNGEFVASRLGRQVFNPGAFAEPTDFGAAPPLILNGQVNPAYAAYYADPTRFFGTLAPVTGEVRGEPYFSENISLLKRTSITETVSLELGAEAFNVFNRTRFFAPSVDFRDVNFGFGSITDQGFYPPRVVQLRARLIF